MKYAGMRTSWLAAAGAFAAGEWIGFSLSSFAFLWPLFAAAASGAVFAACGRGLKYVGYWALFAAGALIAMRAADSRRAALDSILELSRGRTVPEVFTVPDSARTVAYGSCATTTFPASPGGIPSVFEITTPDAESAPRPGEKWLISGWMARGRDPLDPRRRIVKVQGEGCTAEKVGPAGAWSLDSMFASVRESLSRRMEIGLENFPAIADLNRAILLGERYRMPKDKKASFTAAGAIHVFAISGLHVLIVANVLMYMLAFLFVPRRFMPLVSIPVLWAYVRITGMAPSAVRAAVMATLCQGAYVFMRRPDPVSAWTIAMFLSFGTDPFLLRDAGALLSFTVMLSLVVLGEVSRDAGGAFSGSLKSTAAAWCAGVPVIAHLFGRFTPAGLLSNIVLMPLAVVGTSVAAVALAASFVCIPLAAFLNKITYYTVSAMDGFASVLARVPFLDFTVARWSVLSCAAWYAAFIFVARASAKRASFKRRYPFSTRSSGGTPQEPSHSGRWFNKFRCWLSI